MAKEFGLSDEQVEQEIERLSQLVALARREQRLRYKRRMKAGINMEVLNSLAELGDYDDPC